jgi:transcriptional regulator with XRE-family HTH domain
MPELNLIQILDERRLDLGLSQGAFADKLGINRSYYSGLRNGRFRRIPQKRLTEVAAQLSLSLGEVVMLNNSLQKQKYKSITRPPLTKHTKVTARRKSASDVTLEQGWHIQVQSSAPDNICAYRWTDFGQGIEADTFIEICCRRGPVKLYEIMQAAVSAETNGICKDFRKFVIVDYHGRVLYDGKRTEPWAPHLCKLWDCQI